MLSEEFQRSWVNRALPVVIEGVASSWPASSRWTLPALRERFSDVKVQLLRAGRPRGLRRAGGTTYDASTFGRYIDALTAGAADPGYLVTMWEELPESLRADVRWPEVCGRARWSQSTLWFGPRDIVSPMHFDVPDNLYVVVRGRKRFTLVPRATRGMSALTPCSPGRPSMRASIPSAPRPSRATRRAPWIAELGCGDALYIPRFWWHHARGLDLTLAVNFW